jgi:hypothetical protein
MSNLQFEKSSTGATPIFPGAPGFVYKSHPRGGAIHADPRNGNAGGYVPQKEMTATAMVISSGHIPT